MTVPVPELVPELVCVLLLVTVGVRVCGPDPVRELVREEEPEPVRVPDPVCVSDPVPLAVKVVVELLVPVTAAVTEEDLEGVPETLGENEKV